MEPKRTDSTREKPGDPRVEGLATLGWITLSALGLSIPITAVAGIYGGWVAVLLPLAIILGAGIMALRIWSAGEKLANTRENETLQARVQELEERLASLEMIDSLEAHFAGRHRKPDAERAEAGSPPSMGPATEEPVD